MGGEHPVLYHMQDSHEVLALSAAAEFCEIVLHELFGSALGGHLGSKKTYVALLKGVCWPQMKVTFE